VLKRIAITGPESTGKTWLAQQLAAYYQTDWVPEYARTYLRDKFSSDIKVEKHERPYSLADIVNIARGQKALTEALAAMNPPLLIADTEMLVCQIWASYVFGVIPDAITALTDQQQFDLYLLCDTDLPWEPDPLRENPNERAILFKHYRAELDRRSWPYAIVSGQHNERLFNAVQSIEKIR
jgi:nicotinamide riboside kinase